MGYIEGYRSFFCGVGWNGGYRVEAFGASWGTRMLPRLLLMIPTLDACGAEKQFTLLATSRALRDVFDVHVAVLTRSGPYEVALRSAGVPIHFIHKHGKIDPFALWRLRKLMRELRPDLVHTWIFAANAYGRVAAWLEKVPVVIGGERCVDPWKTAYEFAMDRFLAKRSTAIVTNSSGVVDFYAAHGISKSLFHIIPNGIPPYTSPYPDSESRRIAKQKLCESFSIPTDSRLVLLVARLWPQKRVLDAIWATDLLKVVRDDVHLLVIGDGPQRERLRMFRYECRIEDRVHFLGSRSDVAALLPLGDVLWLPSAFEGLPNVILEAMAAGIPVVASDIPGNRDLVVHGETGFLIPTGDAAALSTHVNKTIARGFAKDTLAILEAPALAIKLGNAGRRRAIAQYTVSGMVAAHVALYRRLMEECGVL